MLHRFLVLSCLSQSPCRRMRLVPLLNVLDAHAWIAGWDSGDVVDHVGLTIMSNA
jgi:hypothetical protein